MAKIWQINNFICIKIFNKFDCLKKQVTFNGEYNAKGMKLGGWEISYNKYGKENITICKFYSKVDCIVMRKVRQRLEIWQSQMKGLMMTGKIQKILKNLILQRSFQVYQQLIEFIQLLIQEIY
ncbi:unnamed protein product [Paramecium sonneborni]|uniref:Uncharacterized protein n=1 Tax=Paramecium sonneborni TaxID=65129 RepID=A0A8S1RKJ3_9CILI|nr:unnamed protein product [Paramecium sonneborni]